MLSASKYRIYPRPEQEMRLKRSLLSLCELYNVLRARKTQEHSQKGVSLTKTALRTIALEERRRNQELQSVHSQVVQNVADRVANAFRNYLEGRARFPKSKQSRKYLSLTYPQSGFHLDSKKGLYLSMIGNVRIFIHRPLIGTTRRLTIKREADGWYAIFTGICHAPRKQPINEISNDRIRGADLGLEKFIVLDNADHGEYPEYLRQSEGKIKALQKNLSRKEHGSRRWRRACSSLAKLHLHVRRQREDWHNKCVSEIFKENDILVLEKLNVAGLSQNHGLAKSILDAAFAKFSRKCIFKAEMLGKRVITVDSWGTSQFCSGCLAWVPKSLSQRRHVCPSCGIDLPRDLNSSRLIKRLGILSSPPSDGGSSPAEPRPLPSLRGMVSRGAEAGSHLS